MEYSITYEHLEDELICNEHTRWHFELIRDRANKYKLELSDTDFKRFFRLSINKVDTNWIMSNMSTYESRLTDVLISYITY